MFPNFTYPTDMKARVLARIEDGWRVAALCGEPGWPSRQTLYRWGLEDEGFAAALRWARMVGRGERRRPMLEAGIFDAARAEAFLLSVRRGAAVRDLVRTAGQPNRDLLNSWKRQRPDFAAAILDAAAFSRSLRRPGPRYDEAVADQLLIRVMRGMSVPQVCRDPAMPGETALRRWRRQHPEFDAALTSAKLGGHRRRMKARRRCTPELTDAIAHHILNGGSLRSASLCPGLPHCVTLYGWMKREPEFARAIRLAESMRDERLIDQALVIGQAATPDTVAASARAFAAIRRRAGQLGGGRKPAPHSPLSPRAGRG